MMNWIAGNWSDGFKCIVNHDGVFDTRGMAYATEEIWFTEWENGGPYYEVPATTRSSTRELREELEDADAGGAGRPRLPHPDRAGPGHLHRAAAPGIPSKFLFFPDENHWVLKPANSLLWHHTVLDWLNTYTKK
jgi:dipeptidyl aminopeptidase/acylaminoacyl peptidase